MAAEPAFIQTFLKTLTSQPITLPDDYQQPPENALKKVPVLPIPLPSPPKAVDLPSTSSSISLTFKSAKPHASYTLTVSPTDAISTIKLQLAACTSAPPAPAQRLLVKGKVLADTKLLSEYTVKDGDIVNLMVKPGFHWDPSATLETDKSPSRHQRIPSVVLSPSPSFENLRSGDKPLDITLTVDADIETDTTTSAYHTALASPAFWERLGGFLMNEFKNESDALHAFEDFLLASKVTLTASEIARIRDRVGVVGMAGT